MLTKDRNCLEPWPRLNAVMMVGCIALASACFFDSATGIDEIWAFLSAFFLLTATSVFALMLVCAREYSLQSILRTLIVPCVCIGIIISVATTHWPLKTAYAWSRSALD